MKAKGLQRLKWYCQMCEKQCRDENGFKCHMLSESHARQMQVFAQRPGKFMDDFSRTFEADFMRFMRTRYCRTRVLANTVYCELISNKSHIHMNATIWTTLSEFVRYLGNTGKCEIEKTPRGWYLTYIDQEKLAREKMAAAGLKQYASAEALEEKRLREACEAAKQALAASSAEVQKSTVSTKGEDVLNPERSAIKVPIASKKSDAAVTIVTSPVKTKLTEVFGSYDEKPLQTSSTPGGLRKPNDLVSSKRRRIENDDNAEDKEFPAHPLEDSDLWLSDNLMVRISKAGWEFDRMRGQLVDVQVQPVASKSANDDTERRRPLHRVHAIVRLRTKQKLKVDHQFLETIVPRRGKWARVVLGVYRGFEGRVVAVDLESETVSIALFYGSLWGDLPDDMRDDSIVPCASEQRHKYQMQLKKKLQDPSVLERGELVIHQMPFDTVCRVAPPRAEFDEMDEAFPDDGEETARASGSDSPR